MIAVPKLLQVKRLTIWGAQGFRGTGVGGQKGLQAGGDEGSEACRVTNKEAEG